MDEHYVYVAEAYIGDGRIDQIVHIDKDDAWQDISVCTHVENIQDNYPEWFGEYTDDELEEVAEEIEIVVHKQRLHTGQSDPWW